MSVYVGREQTQAKHFILKGYLQELAFKVLHNWDVAYVDGFSGPWESQKEDFSDTSFMIALKVLEDAQRKVEKLTGRRQAIKCFFSEKEPDAYRQMRAAVAPYHRPAEGFQIKTFQGEFVDAISEIQQFIGSCFPLIFIDPTGWTGYPFQQIGPLFAGNKCETLINFMYGHASRFLDHPNDNIAASFAPILGGPDWKKRLDSSLPPALAMEKLFRETLQSAGNFRYVVSTRIDKATQERPHFFLVYGTKDRAGLKAFREIEYRALREHAKNRSEAMSRKSEARSGIGDLFSSDNAARKEATIDELVVEQKARASDALLKVLETNHPLSFTEVVDLLLPAFMLRETNVKDICVELWRGGRVRNSWGDGTRKPNDMTMISLQS